MTSIVQICNMAIGHIRGANKVQTVFPAPEGSEEARACFIYYAAARDAALEARDWSFASRETTLALVGTPPTRWAYQYAWPNNCLIPREIVSGVLDGEPIPFEVTIDEALSQKLILTDEITASLRYTAVVEDPSMYSAGFTMALSYRLAMDLAIPLKGDAKLQGAMREAFNAAAGEASFSNTNARQAYRRSSPRGSTATRARS